MGEDKEEIKMFYTLEGIDGAGCGVVRRELEKLFKKEKISFTTLKYPVPNLPFGDEIYDFLAGKINLPQEAQFLAFAGQMVIEKERLKKLRKKLLIVDRYLPCTLTFQSAKGFPLKKGIEFSKIFEMEMPDRIFYLKVPWQVGYQRKAAEKRQSDRFEKDKSLFKKTAQIYNQLALKRIFAPWTVIDATQSPEAEAKDIYKVILNEYRNH